MGVRTTSRRFGAWLDDALGAYRIDEELAAEYSVVIDGGRDRSVGSGRRFHVLWQGVGQVSRTLHLPTLGASLLAELEARLLADRDDALYVHHAAVRSGPVTALVPAWFVAYVQAAGRRVERAGLTLPNRRWVAIDPATGVVLPTPSLLHVPSDALRRLEGWSERVEEDPGRADPEVPLVADAVVTYAEGMDTVDVGPRAIAMHRMASLASNLSVLGERAVHGLGLAVQHARAYELGLGRPAQMVDALAAIFEHERRHADVEPVGRPTGGGAFHA